MLFFRACVTALTAFSSTLIVDAVCLKIKSEIPSRHGRFRIYNTVDPDPDQAWVEPEEHEEYVYVDKMEIVDKIMDSNNALLKTAGWIPKLLHKIQLQQAQNSVQQAEISALKQQNEKHEKRLVELSRKMDELTIKHDGAVPGLQSGNQGTIDIVAPLQKTVSLLVAQNCAQTMPSPVATPQAPGTPPPFPSHKLNTRTFTAGSYAQARVPPQWGNKP